MSLAIRRPKASPARLDGHHLNHTREAQRQSTHSIISSARARIDGEEIAAPSNRPPELAPRGSVMATADPDGEHVRLDIGFCRARCRTAFWSALRR
jgi:hypothetical protein